MTPAHTGSAARRPRQWKPLALTLVSPSQGPAGREPAPRRRLARHTIMAALPGRAAERGRRLPSRTWTSARSAAPGGCPAPRRRR